MGNISQVTIYLDLVQSGTRLILRNIKWESDFVLQNSYTSYCTIKCFLQQWTFQLDFYSISIILTKYLDKRNNQKSYWIVIIKWWQSEKPANINLCRNSFFLFIRICLFICQLNNFSVILCLCMNIPKYKIFKVWFCSNYSNWLCF